MLAHLVVAIGTMLGASSKPGIEIHVARASDDARGADATASSLPRAIDRLRSHRAAGDASPARIVIHDGRYELAAPIEIDAALVGDGLWIGAADGAAPLISGGRRIEGLREQADGTWRATIPEVRDGAWWFEEVFADLEPRPRARHPNAGFARVVAAGADDRTSFVVDPAEIPLALVDARSEVVFLHDWSISRVRVAEVDAPSSTLRFAGAIGCRAPHFAIANFEPHPRYFLEGSPAFVDAPGEWALDRATGDFVYMPLPGAQADELVLTAPAAPALLRVIGTIDAPVTGVVMEGLRFAHASWPIPGDGYAEGQASFHEVRADPASDGTRDAVPAAIAFAWARDCRIADCVVAAVGGSGIWIGAGCRDCTIDDVVVRDAGANGIMLGEPASRMVDGAPWWQRAPDQVASGNVVRESLVERCGRRFFGAVGVWIGLAERTTVSRCEIRDLPYTGVSVGWRWDETPTPCRENVIEANHIHHVMRTLSDGGGIYTLGRQPGTALRGNAIHHVSRNEGRAPSNGIFLDQGTTDLVVEDNVFWAIDTTPLRWHWTYRNTVRRNVFVLRAGQAIAHYDRAQEADVAYLDNRTLAAESWSEAEAAPIVRHAGVRSPR